MNSPQCPECFSAMERREVTPCFECGHLPDKLAQLHNRKPEFAEYRVIGRATFVLCILCRMDCGSWTEAYVGQRIRERDIKFLRGIYPLANHAFDFVWPDCNARLAWLEARAACIEPDAK